MKRKFAEYTEAEDFANDMVFGGDDATIVAELVEVWPNEEAWNRSYHDESWGVLYVVWGTDAEVDTDVESLGEYVDSKGRTGRPEEDS